jgi:HSP20 family protein
MTRMMRRMHGPRTLRDEMDRVFDDFFGMVPARSEKSAVWSPAVDIREDENNFVIEVDLPGMSKDDIHLEVEQNQLSIKGERRFEKKEEGESYHFVERSYGSFYRSFTLPKNVDTGAIAAGHKDGVLMITVPKAEEVKPKKVEIKS